MNKKVIRMTESDMHNIITESVKRVLKEYEEDNYYGGGLPDNYLEDDDAPDTGRLTINDLGKLDKCIDEIANIVNNCNDDCQEISDAIDIMELFIEKKKKELIKL